MTDFGGCGASEVNREESTEVRRQQKRESEGHHHDVTETASDDTGPETSPGFRNTAKQLLEPNLVSVIATGFIAHCGFLRRQHAAMQPLTSIY